MERQRKGGGGGGKGGWANECGYEGCNNEVAGLEESTTNQWASRHSSPGHDVKGEGEGGGGLFT